MKPGNQRRSKAFTLVEFLIVVAVVSLLSIAIIANVDNSTDKAKSTGVMTDIRALETAVHQVGIEQGEFVDDLELLSQQLNKNLDEKLSVHIDNNKLVTDATDPWGTEYQLMYSKPAGTLGVLKILSAGQDGSFDTQDDTGIIVSYNKTPNGATINFEEYVYSNDPNNHICVFNCMVKTSQFVKSVGNCTTPTIYFYSCSCGAVGTETFEGSKDTSTHISESKYIYEQQNADQHIKVTKCAGCNESITSSSENHSFVVNKCEHCGYEKHVHTYDQQKIEDKYIKTVATCKNAASYYYVCSCGQQGTESYSYGEALQHNYIAEVTKQPTCKAPGIKTHTCSLCGDSYTSGLTQYAHSYTQQIVNSSTLRSDATCTTKATYYYSCSMCNEKGPTDYFESGEVSLTNHDKNASTETKYSKYNETQHLVETICNGCNKTKQSTYANHAFNNVTHTCISCEQHVHEYDQKITTSKYEKTQATCTQKAVYYYSCVCEAKGTETFESGDLNAHAFYAQTPDDSKYLKSSATCVAQAIYYRSCTGCGLAGTETFSYGEKNSANHTGNTKKTYSFMDDDNHTTKTSCSDCNVELKTNTESHEFDNNHTCTLCKNHVHEYNNKDNLRLAQAATCVAKATYYYNCVCNDIGTEIYEFGTTNPYNHNNQLIPGKELDCHEKCSKCGETTQDGNSHRYQSSIVTNATCTSKGTTQYTCSCGYSYTSKDIPTIAHEPSTTATWSSDHTTVTIQCKNCTKKWSGTTSEYENKKATCTVANQYYHTATVNVNGTNKTFNCGVTHTGSNLGHIAGTAATCTTAQICTRDGCGATLQAKLGHAPATTAIWTSDHSKATVSCTRSECTTSWSGTPTEIVSTNATCTTAKQSYHTVTINVNGTNKTFTCNTTHTGSVLGHAPATTCTWNSDHTKATVNCTRNGCTQTWSSTSTENAIDSATCTTPNTYNHTVTINVNGTSKTFTCTTIHSGSVLGHKSTNGGTASAHTICSVCNAILSANHTYTVKVTTPATCIDKGINTYTCNCGWTYSEQNVAINSNNHIGYVTTYVSKNDTQHNINNECSGCHVVKTTTENHNIVDDQCTVCDWERTFYLSGKWFFNEGPGSNTEIVLPNDTYIQNINFTYGTEFTEYSAQNITVTSTGIEYYNQARIYMGMYGKDFGWELSSFIQIDFGTTAQQVSRDFYYWFVDNAEEARLIEGAYQFANEVVIPNNDFHQKFEFRRYGLAIPLHALIGEHHYGIVAPGLDFEFYLIVDGSVSIPRVYQREDGWKGDQPMIIIMDSPQYVTDSFYQWFISTTTPYAHTHNFNVKNTNTEYVNTEPTCSAAGTYYYSCECGAKGTETFTGNKLSHTTTNHIDSKHLKKAATCTADAIYYQSCLVCDENLTTTFTDSGSAKGHDYSTKSTTSTYLKSSATCQSAAVYYYKCSRCTAKGTTTYTSGNVDATNHLSENLVTTCIPISDTQHQTNITCSKCNTVTSSVNDNHSIVDDVCNTCGYASVIYALSGKWMFIDAIEPADLGVQPIHFTYNGQTYMAIQTDYSSYKLPSGTQQIEFGLLYNSTYPVGANYVVICTYSKGIEYSWLGDKSIDFGTTPQTVSKKFYEWFTANATQQIETSTFYIHTDIGRLEYQYEPGMTFADFIESQYNTNNDFFIDADGNVTLNSNSSGPFAATAPNIVKPEYPIDKDAYYGFEFSTDTIVCDKYYVSGTWKWNDPIVASWDLFYAADGWQNIKFTSNGETFCVLNACRYELASSGEMFFGVSYAYTNYDEIEIAVSKDQVLPITLKDYQVIDFGSEWQTMEQEFYEWFIANATQQIETETFYIHTDNGTLEYQYEPGMTFADFIESEYNDCEHFLQMWGNKIEICNAVYGPFDYMAPNIVKPEYPIDKDAYYGLAKSGLKCDKYYVSGEWQFNDNIVYRDVNNNIIKFEQNISFISNETQYNKMSLIAGGCMMIVYDSTDLWWANAGEDAYWSNNAYRIVDFGNTPQEVSQEFYEWFVANAQTLNKTFWLQDVGGIHKTPIEYTVSAVTIWNDVLYSNCFVTSPEYDFYDSSSSLIEPVKHNAQGSYYEIYYDEACTIPVLKKDLVINGTTYYVRCLGHGGGGM